MALFAETLVEEWSDRRGAFTTRGAKGGLLEADLLAVRHRESREPEAPHAEVQASTGVMAFRAIEACGVELVELSSVVDELMEKRGAGRPIKTTSSTAADIAALIGVGRATRQDEGGR